MQDDSPKTKTLREPDRPAKTLADSDGFSKPAKPLRLSLTDRVIPGSRAIVLQPSAFARLSIEDSMDKDE